MTFEHGLPIIVRTQKTADQHISPQTSKIDTSFPPSAQRKQTTSTPFSPVNNEQHSPENIGSASQTILGENGI